MGRISHRSRWFRHGNADRHDDTQRADVVGAASPLLFGRGENGEGVLAVLEIEPVADARKPARANI
jgi:hypothetical protein